MRDFYDFRRMIAPDIIKSAFWLSAVLSIGLGILALVRGSDSDFRRSIAPLDPNILAFLLVVIVPIVLRVWAEFALVVFEIHRTLEEVRRNTRRSDEAELGEPWAMPVIDRNLDPVSRLATIDEAVSGVWDEFAVDADGHLSDQIEELEREPKDYLRAARMLRHEADLVRQEAERSGPGRDMAAVAQAARELSSALDAIASYVRTLATHRPEDSAAAGAGERLALIEHDFNALYRTFADTMVGIDATYAPALEVG